MLAPLLLVGCEEVEGPAADTPSRDWPEAFALSCSSAFGQGWPPGFQASVDLKQGRYSSDYPGIGDGRIVRVDGPVIVLAEWTIPKGLDNNPEHFTVSFNRQTALLSRVHDYSAIVPGTDIRTSRCEVRPLPPQGGSTDPQPSASTQQPFQTKDTATMTKVRPLVMNFQAKATDCALSVFFGSIGTGTDAPTRQRVEALLEQDPAVVEVQPYLRGREGETELCIRLRHDSEVERLFGALKAVTSQGYLVSIRSRNGDEFRSVGSRRP